MKTPEKAPLKKLTLKRETVRVIVRTGIRTGPASALSGPPGAQDPNSVRQGTLSETGQGISQKASCSISCSMQ